MSLSMPLPVVVLLGVVALLVVSTALGAHYKQRSPRAHRLAERWSVDVLRHIPGWQVLTTPDHAPVDRVIVAPSAVLAVVRRATDTSADRLAAIEGAEHIRRALRAGRERAAHPVVAVLAVTDRDAVPTGGHETTDDVHIVDGIRPERWLHCFAGADLAAEERQAIVSAIVPDLGVARPGRLMWRPARSAA
jgi:hypothetical protein